jgi:hypothetical protein
MSDIKPTADRSFFQLASALGDERPFIPLELRIVRDSE